MSPGPAKWRVFIATDHPELSHCANTLCGLLEDCRLPSAEILRIDPVNGTSNHRGQTCSRDFREGDMLILLSREDSDELSERFARTTTERADERGVIILPVIPRGHGAHPRSSWRRQLAGKHAVVHLSYDAPEDQLSRHVLAGVLPRITLGLAADSEAACMLTVDTAAASADEPTHPELSRAEQAIRGRLFPAALNCLQNAITADATDPLACYWSARLRLAGNRRADLNQAIAEAARAARLEALRSPGSPFERKAWMLAVRAAIALGDEASAMEYLGEGMSGPLSAADWLEVARRHVEMHRSDRALAALEEAFYLDASTLATARNDPRLGSLADDLLRLEQDLRERLRFQVSPLIESEMSILQRLAGEGDRLTELAQVRTSIPAEEDVENLVDMGQKSARRQVGLLNDWAADLASKARHYEQQKTRIDLFPSDREAPQASGFEDWLCQWWPPYARRWDSLQRTWQAQQDERKELEAQCRTIASQLRDDLREFLQSVERFETAALADPLFAPVSEGKDAAPGELILHPSPGESHGEPATDREIIPDLLIPFAPARYSGGEGCRLFRLEPHNDGLGASRAGVYFQQAWNAGRSA